MNSLDFDSPEYKALVETTLTNVDKFPDLLVKDNILFKRVLFRKGMDCEEETSTKVMDSEIFSEKRYSSIS